MRLATRRSGRNKRPELLAMLRSKDPEAISASLQRWARLVVAAGIFAVPIVFNPRTLDPFNLPKLTTIWVFGLLGAGMWWLANDLAAERPVYHPSAIAKLALALLAVTTLATLLSPNPILSFHGLHQRYEGLLSIATYVAMFFLVYVIFRRAPDTLRIIAIALGLAAAGTTLYVFAQSRGLDPVDWLFTSERLLEVPIGTLGNSSFTASFLGIAVPFLLYLVSTSTPALRIAWGVVGIGSLYALWLTQGRAGMLGALAGAGVLVLFLIPRIGPMAKVALIAGAFVVFGSVPALIADPQDRTESVFRAGTAAYRVEAWKGAINMTTARPVLGWGPESFLGQYGQHRTDTDAQRLRMLLSDKPHNIYLHWAATTGLVGLVLYLAVVGTALVMVARLAARDRRRRLLAAAFGGGLIAYLMQGLYSIDVPPLAFMGWLMVAGIAALVARRSEATKREPRPLARAKEIGGGWPLRALAALLLVALLFVALRPMRADHAAWSAESGIWHRWSSDTWDDYERAKSLNPLEAQYRARQASYLFEIATDPATPYTPRTGLLRSIELFEEAVELQRYHIGPMINISRAYARIGDPRYLDESLAWIRRAVEIDPRNPELRGLYAAILRHWAERAPEDLAPDLARRAGAEERRAQALQGR